MTTKEFVGSISAGRPLLYPHSGIRISHAPVFCKARSEEEAIGMFYKVCLESYPVKEGHTGHSVAVEELDKMREDIHTQET